MAQGVECPEVLDDKEWYPLPFANVAKVDTAKNDGDGVDNKKRDVELRLMPRDRFVICDVEKKARKPHGVIVWHFFVSG